MCTMYNSSRYFIDIVSFFFRSAVGLKKKVWPRKELNYWQKLPLFPIPTLAPNWKRSSRKMRAKIPDPKSEKNPKANGMISWTKSRKAKATNEKTPRPNWKKSKAKFLQISNHQNSFAQIVTKPDQPHLIVQVVPMAFWVNLRGWAAGKVPHWLLDLQGERRHSISIFYRLGLCYSQCLKITQNGSFDNNASKHSKRH